MLHGAPPFEAENLKDIRKELSNPNIMIRDDLSPDTKAILQYTLKANSNSRYSIDQVLSHPAVTKHIQEFFEPISAEDYAILMRNFLLNNGNNVSRSLPDCLKEILDLNPLLKNQSSPVEILTSLREFIKK